MQNPQFPRRRNPTIDTYPYIPGEGWWAWCPTEHRSTTLHDSNGKRIGFQIERSLNLKPGVDVPHVRWVSVSKDGEWLRNDNNTFHATWEEAEEAVERKIRRSIARYEGLARQCVAAAELTTTVDSPPTGQININTITTGRPQRLRSKQGCLLAIAIAAGTLIAAVRCIATGL
jgi:hypothetical protein